MSMVVPIILPSPIFKPVGATPASPIGAAWPSAFAMAAVAALDTEPVCTLLVTSQVRV